jgi:hypothetical protein
VIVREVLGAWLGVALLVGRLIARRSRVCERTCLAAVFEWNFLSHKKSSRVTREPGGLWLGWAVRSLPRRDLTAAEAAATEQRPVDSLLVACLAPRPARPAWLPHRIIIIISCDFASSFSSSLTSVTTLQQLPLSLLRLGPPAGPDCCCCSSLHTGHATAYSLARPRAPAPAWSAVCTRTIDHTISQSPG